MQVVYNIFDQAPEDELFPYCQAHGIAIISRVPFDEGSLTGTLTADSRWPDGDWRNLYFTPTTAAATLERVDRLRPLVPAGHDLPELALRYILQHPAVTTTIPGMRKRAHVRANLAASDGERLPTRSSRRCARTAGSGSGRCPEARAEPSAGRARGRNGLRFQGIRAEAETGRHQRFEGL